MPGLNSVRLSTEKEEGTYDVAMERPDSRIICDELRYDVACTPHQFTAVRSD
jgi:hypothetical protein